MLHEWYIHSKSVIKLIRKILASQAVQIKKLYTKTMCIQILQQQKYFRQTIYHRYIRDHMQKLRTYLQT